MKTTIRHYFALRRLGIRPARAWTYACRYSLSQVQA